MTDAHYRLLRLLESSPRLTQRELARELGVSLGKVNYCVGALIEKGWVKARNFRNNKNKLAYAYLLTPRGIEQKAVITVHRRDLSARRAGAANGYDAAGRIRCGNPLSAANRARQGQGGTRTGAPCEGQR